LRPLIDLEQLRKVYAIGEGVQALSGLDLSIEQGQYVAVMGHSGSGKSTLLNLLGCLDRPSSGRYWLGGLDVSAMSDDELSTVRNERIGFVFQSFNLIQQMSILENIEVPLFYQGVPRGQRRRRSQELAELVGLGNRTEHRPRELSGGQQQRVAIARALANEPLVLLADEPTGNLDSHTSKEILAIFADLHARGRTIIMVTHEDDVAEHAQRVVSLHDGRVHSDELNWTRQEAGK
jgi:putative ABC transport system ATP-binding protein